MLEHEVSERKKKTQEQLEENREVMSQVVQLREHLKKLDKFKGMLGDVATQHAQH